MLMTFHPRAIQAMDSLLTGVREEIYDAQLVNGELTWDDVETSLEEAIAKQYTYDGMFTTHLQHAFHKPSRVASISDAPVAHRACTRKLDATRGSDGSDLLRIGKRCSCRAA